MFRLFAAGLCFLLSACQPKDAFDPRTVETEAGAALVRAVLADCPETNDQRKMCLTLGPQQAAASEAFLKRLPDLLPRMLPHNRVTVLALNGKPRVLEKSNGITTGDLIILLQITEIKPANGNYQAIAAWAFKDSLRRRNYTILTNADGTFKVEPGGVIEEK